MTLGGLPLGQGAIKFWPGEKLRGAAALKIRAQDKGRPDARSIEKFKKKDSVG